MKRFGMIIKLKPGAEASYRAYHANMGADVLRMITECNIKNYSIYCKDETLFSYFEYHGENMDTDWARMAADPKTQEWWAIINPLQEPLPTCRDGEWWADMDEVFHLD